MRRDEVPTVAERVAEQRAAQGLPRHITDPGCLERVATLVEPRRDVEPDVRERGAA